MSQLSPVAACDRQWTSMSTRILSYVSSRVLGSNFSWRRMSFGHWDALILSSWHETQRKLYLSVRIVHEVAQELWVPCVRKCASGFNVHSLSTTHERFLGFGSQIWRPWAILEYSAKVPLSHNFLCRAIPSPYRY